MAKPQAEKLSVPVTLKIWKDTYEKIAAETRVQNSDFLTAETFAVMCSQFLDVYANGGMMLKKETIKIIETTLEQKIQSEGQLTIAIQKAASRDDGQFVLKIKIDPALMPPLQDYATTVGWTVEQVADDIAHKVVRDNLMFYISQQAIEPVVYLTEKQSQTLQKLTGKKRISGEDILALVEAKETAKETAKEVTKDLAEVAA